MSLASQYSGEYKRAQRLTEEVEAAFSRVGVSVSEAGRILGTALGTRVHEALDLTIEEYIGKHAPLANEIGNQHQFLRPFVAELYRLGIDHGSWTLAATYGLASRKSYNNALRHLALAGEITRTEANENRSRGHIRAKQLATSKSRDVRPEAVATAETLHACPNCGYDLGE